MHFLSEARCFRFVAGPAARGPVLGGQAVSTELCAAPARELLSELGLGQEVWNISLWSCSLEFSVIHRPADHHRKQCCSQYICLV